jgi:hypothetical protein
MTITNNPARAAFLDLAKEVKAGDNRLAKLVQPLIKLDVTKDDLKGSGKYFADLKEGVALAYLTPAEYKIFSDTSLAQKVNGVLTERGSIMAGVASNIAKVRAKIIEAMAMPKEKRGPKEKSTPTQAFFKVIDEYVERFAKDGASDTFDFDPITARAALVKMLSELR